MCWAWMRAPSWRSSPYRLSAVRKKSPCSGLHPKLGSGHGHADQGLPDLLLHQPVAMPACILSMMRLPHLCFCRPFVC